LGRFIRGDVVIVPFPFTNQIAGKVRPALVLAAPVSNEVILCQVTSSLYDDGYSILISAEDFNAGKLKHNSYARLPSLFTCADDAILGKAGLLKPEKTTEIVQRIADMLTNQGR
jgi:mRNA interferase MazF